MNSYHPVGFEAMENLRWILLGIGFLLIAFTDGKKGLHDMIAGTRVVRR